MTSNISLANPIYAHSGETEKLKVLSEQASINEDLEQRRRLLDKRGEQQKKLVALEVAHLLDHAHVSLKATPFEVKVEPVSMVELAKEAVVHKAAAVTNATAKAVDSATHKASSLLHSITATVNKVAHTAAEYTHDAALTVQDTALHATNYANYVAHSAVDTVKVKAGEAAYTVKEKAIEAVEAVENTAHKLTDNISHFTTLIAVLADEENERARRLVSGDEARAAANAFRISALIRETGPALYKQTPNLLYTTKVLEESERRWRLNSNQSQLAENNAHKEGKLVANNLQSFVPRHHWVRNNVSIIEEKERVRRLNDTNEAYAMLNAFALSWVVRELGLGFYRQEGVFSKSHRAYAVTLLEENERRSRIRLDKLQRTEELAHHLMDVVSHNHERFNSSTRNASRFASEFAHLIGTATDKVANQFGQLTKDLALNAQEKVQTVSLELSAFSNLMYIVALEERERARRLSDPAELDALINAWHQSQLIRELSIMYKSTSFARFPLGLIEETERAWRVASVKPNASRFVAGIVHASRSKFELAAKSAGEREHVKVVAPTSRLNPNAPAFVPLPAKVEPVIALSYIAAGAHQ